jgi:hypothetical protein
MTTAPSACALSRRARLGAALRAELGARELHFYGGLAVAGVGGVMLSPAVTLVAIGAVLALVGLALRAPASPTPPADGDAR